MKTISERALYRIRRVPAIGHSTYMTVKSAISREEFACSNVNIWYGRHVSHIIVIAV